MTMQWFAFKTGQEALALRAEQIQRVLDQFVLTPVPLMPPYHKGLLYDRGNVYDVIDPGVLLDGETAVESGPNSRIILLWDPCIRLALLTDMIVGPMEYDPQKVDPLSVSFADEAFRVLTPDRIWSLLTVEPDGPGQI